MANPFVAGQDPTSDLPGADTFNNLREQWNTFLDQPGGRAALLSAGLQLMQPPSFGDTGAGQIGRAIGAAGETTSRREAMDIRQQEAESKAALREASANLAGARAATAGLAGQLGAEKLQNALTIAREREANRMSLGRLTSLNNLHKGYLAYRTKREGDILNKEPVLPFDKWVAQDPAAQEILRRSGGTSGVEPTPTTGGITPQERQDALDWLDQNPNDPRADAVRQKLGL